MPGLRPQNYFSGLDCYWSAHPSWGSCCLCRLCGLVSLLVRGSLYVPVPPKEIQALWMCVPYCCKILQVIDLGSPQRSTPFRWCYGWFLTFPGPPAFCRDFCQWLRPSFARGIQAHWRWGSYRCKIPRAIDLGPPLHSPPTSRWCGWLLISLGPMALCVEVCVNA